MLIDSSCKNMVVGVDLAGVETRPSGICLLEPSRILTHLLFLDEQILDFIVFHQPSIVAVDAPLNLPPGRKSMDVRNRVHFRPCDEELLRRRIRFFPITLGPMRILTQRAIRLKERLEQKGFHVVEIYPGGAQDLWGIPRARRDREGLRKGLMRLGLKSLKKDASGHELDAATGALVGRLFLEGKAEVLGDFASGAILMPRLEPAPSRSPGVSSKSTRPSG